MAPEMLAKKGYSTSVDWWSLGIVAFELLFGVRPFRAKSKEELIHSILCDPLVFPQNVYDVISMDCIDVLTGVSKFNFFKKTYSPAIIVAGQITLPKTRAP
ncbi:Putative AGC/YANK protein kinase [Rhizopus microsporus]|nr:Putative AGC/YANK protein kinase [Rhizopus microsporus]